MDWQYVYFTEDDSILNIRSSAISQLKHSLDYGMILFPHRLILLPHEHDLGNSAPSHRYVPAQGEIDNFSKIYELDAEKGDSCCDMGKEKFGTQQCPKCHKHWYMCCFMEQHSANPRRFAYFSEFDFIRLKQGTNLVLLAGLGSHKGNHRRCAPRL